MNKTKLRIRRFIVKANLKTVYDEKFHRGVNVIRGENSTGKSTIMELLSYSLGGDIKKGHWKKEATDCTEVCLALSLNGRDFVFKRSIESEVSYPQIKIFEGTYESSLTAVQDWQSYKHRRSESRKSFSEQIFELLGLETHTTKEDGSLTMHQLLRILYIDQDTPASKIFRTEPFLYDRESMRKAIGEYSFGFDNLEAHALRQELYQAEKKFDKLDSELKAIYKLLEITQVKATKIEISSELIRLKDDLVTVNEKRKNLQSEQLEISTDETKQEVKQLREKIEKYSAEYTSHRKELNFVSYDISDNTKFLETLYGRKEALGNADKTSQYIESIEFEFCPCCMKKIEVPEDLTLNTEKQSYCPVCKSTSDNAIDESYIQALNELDFQILETSQVLEKRVTEKSKMEAQLTDIDEALNRLRENLIEVNSYSNDYEIKLSQLFNEKGFIEAQIENLKEKLALAAELDRKVEEKAALQAEITRLTGSLESIEHAYKARVRKVKSKISEKVVSILARDNGTEKAFKSAKQFKFDFGSDSMRLDDRANFSASSNVILKNTFHLAVLLVSIKDPLSRIPCFSMFDNIEDKGMREVRSKNFQRIILDEFSSLEEDFQLIMTTSMVDSSLNTKEYGVGEYYDIGTHTLSFDKSS